MPGIGETLREARRRNGMDLADVEAATKIRGRYLRALENEQWDALPGPTFVRTFLRTYSEHLGLDSRRIVEQYRAEHEPREEGFPRARGGARRSPPPRRAPRAGLVLAVLVLAVIGGLYALGRSTEEEDPARPAPVAQRESATERQRAARVSRERRRRQAARRRARARAVTLRIAPSEPTYVCLEDGGGSVLYEGTLAAARSFPRRRELRLNLGRRTVSLRVNGRTVRVEPGSDPIGFAFTPRGRRTLPTGQRPTCT